LRVGGEAGAASATPRGTSLPLGRLSPAEQRVFELVARGHSNREIADGLVLTEATVRSHLTRIYSKLEVRGRADLLSRLAAPRSAHPTDDATVVPAGSPRPVAARGAVLAVAAAVVIVLAIAIPVTALLTGPVLLVAALLLLRPAGGTPGWLRWVLIAAAVLLSLAGVAVAIMLLALLGSG
jgi:DNA-binding CsgD family transcriptional regulator